MLLPSIPSLNEGVTFVEEKITWRKTSAAAGQQQGREPLKSLWQGLDFFCIFEKSEKNQAADLVVSQLLGSTITANSSYVPGQHIRANGGQGPRSSSPKQWKLDGHLKIYRSVSTRLPLTKSKKKQIVEGNYRKHKERKELSGVWILL